VEPIYGKLTTLDESVKLFLTSPSVWHYCMPENELHQYVLPDTEEDE
jgi:hypothetical protein